MYAFPQKENKGTGVSGLKNSRDFTKTKRKAQRGQRNMRVYFSSRGGPGAGEEKYQLKTEEKRNLHVTWLSKDRGVPKASRGRELHVPASWFVQT